MQETSLYLVPTPIGNLEDITLRALKVLRAVDLILAEDTQKSHILLRHHDIKKPMKSFHNFNEHTRLNILMKDLANGKSMALITDAGTPAIADPGFLLVRECLRKNISIECLPGPTALIPALVKSGFPTNKFVFEGFLPHKKGKQSALKKLVDEERSIILYESPHRLQKTLQAMVNHFGGDRKISVSRELTKIYEETITGNLEEVTAHFETHKPRGEIVIVLAGTN